MNKKYRKLFYSILLIVGFFLIAWQVTIYRNTIIEPRILIGIILFFGFMAFVVDFKNYEKTYELKGIRLYFYSTFNYLCGFGFIACSIFMLTNFYFAEKISVIKTFKIIERSSLPGRKHHRKERQPTFEINYDGQIKELVFSHDYYDKMEFYTNVELEIRKGYFGFDILENKKLNL